MSADSSIVDMRTARRLLSRNRSVWVSVALIVAIAAAVIVIVEAILWALGLPPALLAPSLMISALTEGGLWGWVITATAGVLGLACLWGALAPGRTHRRILSASRAPIVVDDAVIAGAVSRSAARAAGVAPSQVTTHLSGRRALVSVRPSSGFAVDTDAVARAGDDLLTTVDSGSALRSRVQLEAQGSLS